MKTLTKIIDNVSYFEEIGTSFHLIERDSNYKEFSKAFNITFNKSHVADSDTESDNYTKNCYAILVVKAGSEMIPLYKNQSNYIVGETGKTFKNLTFK